MITEMVYETYSDLLRSPLAQENAPVEKILLQLDIDGKELGCGTKVETLRSCLQKIFRLLDDNYHSREDRIEDLLETASPVLASKLKLWKGMLSNLMPISDLPQLRYPSDIILENVFRILFETEYWDSVIADGKLEPFVEKLVNKAIDRMHTANPELPPEERNWRKTYNRLGGQLFEIWSGLLERLEAKRKRL